ncbi:MAG: hypothetical protein ACI8T1_004667 [Verrucomicrobiales bacterium]|jgi:hypothetical protein
MNKLIATGQLLVLSGCLSIAQAEDKVNFEKDVYPFLKNSCVNCHRAPYLKEGRTKPTKPKADLRFDAAFGIVAGGEGGAVVVPGDPSKSPILQRTMLDSEHDDFMPPKGDALTDEQKKTLEKWITEGADFGDWKGSEEARPEDAKDTFE